MKVRVECRSIPKSAAAQLHATIIWNADNTFWIYRLSDPTGTFTINSEAFDIARAPTGYLLRRGTAYYSYIGATNMVLVHDFPSDRLPPKIALMDVTPAVTWFRCCPPDLMRPWSEVIGRDSPAQAAGSTIVLRRSGNDKVIQTRSDPDGGVSETTFSLEFGANVIGHRYLGTNPKARSSHGRYKWRKARDGVCTLDECEFTKSQPGKPDSPDRTYHLNIDYIDLEPPAANSFDLQTLMSYLPEDCIIQDQRSSVTKVIPHPGGPKASDRDRTSQTKLDQLSKDLRARGFLKGNKP